MKFMSSQPATQYYAWQAEVMLNNFIHYGVNPEQIHLVCSYEDSPDSSWTKLANHFNTVNFFFYKDTRVDDFYISSIRPNTLKNHFYQHPELVDDVIFYHDCDILLTKPFDYVKFIEDDMWYLSNTTSYISSEYIKSKENDIFKEMCSIINIPPEEVIRQENLSGGAGGAQYIMKNITHLFWHKVEVDSTTLYRYFTYKEKNYSIEEYQPIQKWTADMWAVLWNAWLFGHQTTVHDDLDFTWPADSYKLLDSTSIYHNAGATEDHRGIFKKTDFVDDLPYNKDLHVISSRASYFYWQWVQKSAENSCLVEE